MPDETMVKSTSRPVSEAMARVDQGDRDPFAPPPRNRNVAAAGMATVNDQPSELRVTLQDAIAEATGALERLRQANRKIGGAAAFDMQPQADEIGVGKPTNYDGESLVNLARMALSKLGYMRQELDQLQESIR